MVAGISMVFGAGTRDWRVRLGGLLLAGLAAGLLIVMELALQDLLPRRLWQLAGLENVPVRAVPLLLALAIAAIAVARFASRIPSLETAFIMSVLATAQLNGFALGPLDSMDAVIFGFFAIWLARRALDPDFHISIPAVVFFGLALLILQFPNIVHQRPGNWFVGLFGMTRAVLIALLVVNACRSPDKLRFFQSAFLVVATLSASVAIVQFLAGYLFGYYFTLIQPAEEAFKPTPLGFVMRASAFCITAQHLSGFLTFATPFALWRFTETWRVRDALVVLILWTGILFTWNFGAIFAAAAVGGLFLFVRWPNYTIHFLLVVPTLGALLYFAGYAELIYDLTFGDAGVVKGFSQRVTLFKLGLEQIQRNPWVGTGLQGFGDVHGNFWHRPVHNALGQAGTELGVQGALVFIAMLATLITQTILLASGPPGEARDLARRMLLVYGALLVLMQAEPMLDHANTWLMLGFGQVVVVVAALRRAAPRSL